MNTGVWVVLAFHLVLKAILCCIIRLLEIHTPRLPSLIWNDCRPGWPGKSCEKLTGCNTACRATSNDSPNLTATTAYAPATIEFFLTWKVRVLLSNAFYIAE